MKIKKIIIALMTITLIAIGIIGGQNAIPTQAAQEQTIVFSENNVNLVVKPGEVNHIILPIKTIGYEISQPEVTVFDKGTGSVFTFTKPTLKYTIDSNNISAGISSKVTTYVEFDVTVKETAVIGSYPVALSIAGQIFDYLSGNIIDGPITFDFNLQVLEEKAPIQLTASGITYKTLVPGSKTDLILKVKNEGEITARNIYINMDYKDTGIQANYSAIKVKVGDILPGTEKYITLPISALPTAIPGNKTVTANFEYKDMDGGDPKSGLYNIDIIVKENENAPIIEIDSISYGDVLRPGDAFVLVVNLANYGVTDAEDIEIAIDAGAESSFIKDYYTNGILVPNIKVDSKRKVEIPLIVAQSTKDGLNELKLNISYMDGKEIPYLVTKPVYLDVLGATNANVIISNVKQSPEKPVAGEKVEISFDFENRSTTDISELKISTDYLANNNFIPVESEPYQYIEKLKSGTKMRITIPLIVSDTVSEGVNNLDIKYSYAGSEGGKESILIRNVINDLGSSSKPKLIVSNYSADVEELRAGSIFNFTFDLLNTNSSVAAKNITVTVTQEEKVFTVTNGSNSFFINKIDPGETVTNTLELKVKSDASTKAYPLIVTVEYEYDGIKPNPTTGETGETKPIELNLQAVENSRPVIDYVNVYSYDGTVKVSNPSMLSFEFYNMGKSPLNNVIATVEGDFMASAGSMYFIGNVEAGASAYAEFEVIPNVEGLAKGVVKITFEDSNGEEVAFTKEFETTVMGAQVFDPGMVDGGVDVFNPTVPVAKKPILPIWLFIIIQVIIFALFIPVTRKVIIGTYKAKLRKKEEEKF